MAKDDKKGKGKGKAKGDAPEQPGHVHLAAHPRAARHIATAKGWGGLLGFVIVGWLSYRAGSDAFAAGLRALAGGMGFYLLAWAGTVLVWREIAVAEVHRARQRAFEAHQAALAAQAAEQADRAVA